MAEAIVAIIIAVLLLVLFGHDEIAQILSARKSTDLEIEKERTEQKRLELEIAKAQSASKTEV